MSENKKLNEILTEDNIDHAYDFIKFISGHQQGDLAHSLGVALKEIHDAVKYTGKEGAVVLTIKVEPPPSGKPDVIPITPSFKLRKPSPDVMTDYFFRLRDGRISPDPYVQGSFDYTPEEKSGTRIEFREEVDPDTGEVKE